MTCKIIRLTSCDITWKMISNNWDIDEMTKKLILYAQETIVRLLILWPWDELQNYLIEELWYLLKDDFEMIGQDSFVCDIAYYQLNDYEMTVRWKVN